MVEKRDLAKLVNNLVKYLKRLHLSTKLIIANSILILFVSGVLTLGLYWQLRVTQRQAIQERLYDILSFSAPLVDGDFHSLIRFPEDEASSFYRIVFLRLESIQKTSNVIERIYTLRQLGEGRLIYVVDVDNDFHANVGQEYLRTSPLLDKGLETISGPIVEDNIYNDSAGTFLSGYVPIYDQFNDLDGVLGIDINAASVTANERQARRFAVTAFLVTVPFSLILGGWLARKLISPVSDLIAGAERVGRELFDDEVPVRSQDELGILAEIFNRMASQLQQTMKRLELEIAKYAQAQKLQNATYRISQAAIATNSLDELYSSIHSILGELIFVENFYIALYNSSTGMVNFPYYIDQYDEQPTVEKLEGGLTEYVLRTGKSLLATPDSFANLAQNGEVKLVGTKPIDWLGVPLKVDDTVVGIMGTQSYSEDIRFTQETVELLEFVSTQVAQAIERKRTDEALRRSNERYYRLFEESPIALWEEDFSAVKQLLNSLQDEGVSDIRSYLVSHPEFGARCAEQVRILDVNKATLILFGAESKEEILSNLAMIFCDESYVAFEDELVYIAEGRTEFNWEGINQTLDGKRIDISMSWSMIPGYEHDYSKVIISMIDITKRREFESKLTYLSTHDALTGLYNRAYFEDEMARLERGHQFPVSIVMADLDDLKVTNDRDGHAAGDRLIQETAQVLLASFRTVDVVARIGGDEFAILLPETNEAATEQAILRIKNNLQRKRIDHSEMQLCLSLGASTVEESGSLEEALDRADKKMYLDKQSKTV